MSEEKLKWGKTNKLGQEELVKNLEKMTNLIINNELKDVMGKLDTLKRMGVISDDNEALKKLKKEFSKITDMEK